MSGTAGELICASTLPARGKGSRAIVRHFMSRRLPLRIVLGLGLLAALARFGSAAAAQAPAPASAPAAADTTASAPAAPVVAKPAQASTSDRHLKGFQLLAHVGYGRRTAPVFDIELEPYGATFGAEAGYTFGKGLRLAVYLDYGLGRSISQTFKPLIRDEFELTTQASSLNTGLALGHDLWLHFFILRYSLSFGITWLSWDLGSVPRGSILDLATPTGSTVGFHLAPGLALLWPFELLECGVGLDYFVQTDDTIPSGYLAKLLLGVRL